MEISSINTARPCTAGSRVRLSLADFFIFFIIFRYMKLKVLHHDPKDFQVAQAGRMTPIVRSTASHLHAFTKEREMVRAVTAAKLDRMFAKPLSAVLTGHTDGISAMSRGRTLVAPFFTGSYDGEIRFWNAAHKRCFGVAQAHTEGQVRGICVSTDDKFVFTAGGDRTVKSWLFDREAAVENDVDTIPTMTPVRTYNSSAALTCIDHHWKQHEFATGSDSVVDIWDPLRSQPRQSFEWGCEGVVSLKYNPAETSLLAATTRDNGILLFDVRAGSAVKKLVLKMRSNAIAWNPREPQNFTVANEDCNLYSFDMRKMETASYCHKGHVQAVLDVDYHPNGLEIVSGSYDKTIRIFDARKEKSREVYYTKRMQRLNNVRYSADGRFIFSGSEDMNVRMWKAKASEKLGVVSDREKRSLAYRDKLQDKFANVEEVKLISSHRHVPKFIKNQGKQRNDHFESRKKKESNQEAHSKVFKRLSDKERIIRDKKD